MAEGHGRRFGVLVVVVAIVGAASLGHQGSNQGAYISSSAPAVVPAGMVSADLLVTTTTTVAVTPPAPTTTTTKTTIPPVVTTTPVVPATAPATSTTAPAPATTTTTAVVACRNSTDPACGPFRFDPQPGPDRPMWVHIVVAPSSPVAGQEAEFTVTLTDPDGVSYAASTYNWGDSGIGDLSVDPCTRFGPWDPPAPDPSRATEVLRLRHTYAQPGTYRVVLIFGAEPFACVDSVSGRGDRPYASSASGTVTIEVR